MTNTISLEAGIAQEWLGFLVMFIAFSTIFVAIKQYRDESLGGVIRFSTGFLLGLGIIITVSLIYVLVWEIYLFLTDYAFINDNINGVVAQSRAEGVSESVLATKKTETEVIRQQYSNPLFRLPMTFIEIFPVGLLISLISALILKDNKNLAAE